MVSFNGGSGVYQASDVTYSTQVAAENGIYTNVSVSRTFTGLAAGTYWVALRDTNDTSNKKANSFAITTCPTTTTTTQAPVSATVSGACTGDTQTITVNSFTGGDGSTYYVSNTTYGDAGSAGAATANVLVVGGTVSYGSQPSGTRYVKIASTIRTNVVSGGSTCTTTSTTSTTTQPQVWYYLYNCSTGAIETSASYLNGTFYVNQRVVYGGSLFFYVTQVVFSNPGGIQWSVSSAGAGLEFCPATTTTTTVAPIVTSYYVATRCDNPSLQQYFQTTGSFAIGESVRYNGYCWEIQALTGASGVNYVTAHINCAACNNAYPTTTTSTSTTTTTIAPSVLTCFTISSNTSFPDGCNGTSNEQQVYTVTLKDQFGNSIAAPYNMTFEFSYDFGNVEDNPICESSGTSTATLNVYSGNTFGQYTFYTFTNINCCQSGICNGSCYSYQNNISYVSNSAGLSLC
jgi:hypothetical protein